jgi:hypothetical protein
MRRVGRPRAWLILAVVAACGRGDAGGDAPRERPQPMRAPAAAPPAPAPPPTTAMPTPSAGLVLALEVDDFDAWKRAFDAELAARRAAGIVWHSVARGERREVYVHMLSTDADKLAAFADAQAASRRPEAMWRTRDVAVEPAAERARRQTYSVFGRHTVDSLAAWKQAFDAEVRGPLGVVAARLARAADDPATVVVHLTVEDPEQGGRLAALLAAAGLPGKPELMIARDVEVSSY